MLAKERAQHAAEEYKKSTTFKDEMTKARTESYQMCFTDCQKKISRLHPELDFSSIIIGEEDDEGDGDQQVAEELEAVPP